MTKPLDVPDYLRYQPNLIQELRDEIATLTESNEVLSTQYLAARGECDGVKRAFADEVIALITTEQASMSRLYSKHEYGINKVCNRLKIFVGDLLKKPVKQGGGDG